MVTLAPGVTSTRPSSAIGSEATKSRFFRIAARIMASSAGLLRTLKSIVGCTRGSKVLAKTLPRLRGLTKATKR